MKKIARILLVVLLVLSLVGCGAQKDPKTIVIEASEKTAALEYQEIEELVKITVLGMEIEMPGTSRTIMKDGQLQAMSAETESVGTKTAVSYVDGVVYMETMGVKIKAPATLEEFDKFAENVTYVAETETIESVTAGEKDADGNQLYTVVLKQEAIDKMMKSVVEDIAGEGVEAEITDFVYTATVNTDGYLSKIELTMVIKIKEEGMTMACDTVVTAEYKNPGEKFEITAPEDAADYMEYKMSDLIG